MGEKTVFQRVCEFSYEGFSVESGQSKDTVAIFCIFDGRNDIFVYPRLEFVDYYGSNSREAAEKLAKYLTVGNRAYNARERFCR